MRLGLTFNVRSQSADAEEEYDSPETIAALAGVLSDLGHQVDLLGDGEPLLRRLLDGPRPDLVFNIAEGAGAGRSREARVPAVLEMLGIPYTGSDPLTLSVTLDKDCAKRLVAAAGVKTPAWQVYDPDREPQSDRLLANWLGAAPPPWIIKPACEGSSKGIVDASVFEDAAELRKRAAAMYADYRQPLLIEQFIDGEELTVGVIGNRLPQVLGAMRIIPTDPQGPFVYSLEVKRDFERRVRYECPARLPQEVTQAVHEAALLCWQALGCRDVSRFDFRLRGREPYFLECNPLPGLSPQSGDLVILARAVGVDHRELVRRILAAAQERL